jgi:hypothetical protein
MTIQVGWGNAQKSFILYSFDGAWTWHEFYAAIDIAQRLASTVTDDVGAIIDMTSADDLPSSISLGINIMSHARKTLIYYAQSSAGPVVIVGAKPLIKALWDTFRAVSGPKAATNVRFVRTLDDAYGILNSQHLPNAKLHRRPFNRNPEVASKTSYPV